MILRELRNKRYEEAKRVRDFWDTLYIHVQNIVHYINQGLTVRILQSQYIQTHGTTRAAV